MEDLKTYTGRGKVLDCVKAFHSGRPTKSEGVQSLSSILMWKAYFDEINLLMI